MKNSTISEFLENAPFGYSCNKAITDDKGVPSDYIILEVNRTFEIIAERNKKEILGKKVSEIFPEWFKSFINIAGNKGNITKEHYFQNIGKWFRIQTNSAEEDYFSMVFLDITEYISFEDELIKEKQRFKYFIDVTNLGTWEWVLESGEVVFNERWANIIGYTLEEISPVSIKTWEQFTHPDDLKESSALIEKHLRGESDFYEFECRMKHKNGEWVWVSDRGKISARDAEGKPLVISGTHQDITDRKVQTEKL